MAALKKLYNVFSSMGFGIILLALVAVCSAIGTMIMPGLFYKTWFFRLLLILLFINIALCLAKQAAMIIKSKKARKSIFRSVSLLTLHGGIALIIIGAAVNGAAGIREEILITKGETVLLPNMADNADSLFLRLNDFEISFYEDGSASQYYGDIEIGLNDTWEKGSVSVNKPYKLGGAKLYILDYEYLTELEGRSNDGWQATALLSHGDRLDFPIPGISIEGECYVPNFDPALGFTSKTARPDNPQILYYFYDENTPPALMSAPIGRWVKVKEGLFYRFNGVTPRVKFIYKYDPSLPFISVGGIMLIGGILAFYIKFGKNKKGFLSRMFSFNTSSK